MPLRLPTTDSHFSSAPPAPAISFPTSVCFLFVGSGSLVLLQESVVRSPWAWTWNIRCSKTAGRCPVELLIRQVWDILVV